MPTKAKLYKVLGMVSRFAPGQLVNEDDLKQICPQGERDFKRLMDLRVLEEIDPATLPEHIEDFVPMTTGVNLPNAPVPQLTDKQHRTYVAHDPETEPEMDMAAVQQHTLAEEVEAAYIERLELQRTRIIELEQELAEARKLSTPPMTDEQGKEKIIELSAPSTDEETKKEDEPKKTKSNT
jgi:hypothetical protein